MTGVPLPPEPRVTALVAAYNAAEFVGDTLRSLAAQAHVNLRVLVSVDRSDDDTAARCAAFAGHDPRFTVIVQPERLGWIGNTNALLHAADGDLGFFMGHDDLVEPGYVARLVAALRDNPAAVLAFADLEVRDACGMHEIVRYADLDDVSGSVERGRRLFAHRRPWWAAYRGLFHVEAARRAGGLRRHLGGEFAADWPFVVALALQGECIRVPEVLYRKRYRTTSLSRQWRYGNLPWLAAYLSCARTVAGVDLTVRERLALLTALASGACGALARSLQFGAVRPREATPSGSRERGR